MCVRARVCVCACVYGHSHGAGLAAGLGLEGVVAAQPGSHEVGGGVVGAQAARVAAAHLAEHLDPLAGLHTVPCLHVQRLLNVDHLKHLRHRHTHTLLNA